MNGILIVTAVIAIVVVIFAILGLCIVPQSEARVIERLGRYYKTLSPGINIVWPILDQARVVYTRHVVEDARGMTRIRFARTARIDLREQVYDFPKQNVITKDNVQTEINALLYFQIVDPLKSVYEIDNLPNAIEKLTQTTLRNVVGEMELDETLTSRDIINSKLRSVLDDATNKWGVKVNRVELQDITPPASVRDAMESQMQAERSRRAEILKAEGEKKAAILMSEGEKESKINKAMAEKQSQILQAEGEAKARILQAQAEAEAICKITEAIGRTKTDPAAYLIANKYIETLKEMVSGKENKTIYLPYEATSLLGSIGGIKDLFQK